MVEGLGRFLRVSEGLDLSPAEKRHLAALLGYHGVASDAWEPPPVKTTDRPADSEGTVPPVTRGPCEPPTGTPFFRCIERVEAAPTPKAETPRPKEPPLTAADVAPLDRLRFPDPPEAVPWPALWPQIFDLVAEVRPSLRVDTRALVRAAARLEMPRHLPRRVVRDWPARLDLVIDGSPRLAPLWSDFRRIEVRLKRLMGPRAVTLHRWFVPLVGPSYPRGRSALFLTDLGHRGGDDARALWAREMEIRQRRGQRSTALVPLLPGRANLPAGVRAAAWGPRSLWLDLSPSDRAAAVERLLTLAVLAHRVDAGWLRAVRQAALGPAADLGIELDAWASPALRLGADGAAGWVLEEAERFRDRLKRAEDVTAKARALALLKAWHQPSFGRDLWPEELASIDATLGEGASEVRAALQAVEADLIDGRLALRLIATLEGGETGLAHLLGAYLRDVARRAPRLFEPADSPWRKALQRAPAPLDPRAPLPLGRNVRPEELGSRRPKIRPTRLAWAHTTRGLEPIPGPPVIDLEADRDGYSAEWPSGPQASGRASRPGSILVQPEDLGDKGRLTLVTSRGTATVEGVRREDWMHGLGRDRFGLFAEVRPEGMPPEAWMKLRWIPPGTYLRGSPEDEPGRRGYEGPRHRVTLTQGFWLADAPCTQALWVAVMGKNRSRFTEPKRPWLTAGRPVEQVSWEDAQEFLKRLEERGLPGARLPTEAEWEYACRAGTETATYAGPLDIRGEHNAPALDAIAWYGGNSGVGYELENGVDSSDWEEKQYPHEKAGTRWVRTREPNPWGLYDMLGNVWEWCEDAWDYGQGYGSEEPLRDPRGERGAYRVYRGGSWFGPARYCRAAYRIGNLPGSRVVSLGFRVSRGQAQDSSPGSSTPRRTARRRPREKRGQG